MSQNDFLIYFIVIVSNIIFYGFPILLSVFFGLNLRQKWPTLTTKQRRSLIYLVSSIVVFSFVLGYIDNALSLQYIYGACLLFLALIANLILALILYKFIKHHFDNGVGHFKLSLLLTGIFLFGSLSFSPIMSRVVTGFCDSINLREVAPLVQAMETYKDDKGFYPEDFLELFPTHIQKIPEPLCLKPYSWFNLQVFYPSYTILNGCDGEPVLVVFSSSNVQSAQIYNSSTKSWRYTDYWDIYYNESCH